MKGREVGEGRGRVTEQGEDGHGLSSGVVAVWPWELLGPWGERWGYLLLPYVTGGVGQTGGGGCHHGWLLGSQP